VLQVQDRLNQTSAQIERVEGRRALLEGLADLATLRLELQSPGTPVVAEGGSSGPLDAGRAGCEASLDTLRAIASVGLATVAYSWWLLPIITLALFALRRWGYATAPRARYDGHLARQHLASPLARPRFAARRSAAGRQQRSTNEDGEHT